MAHNMSEDTGALARWTVEKAEDIKSKTPHSAYQRRVLLTPVMLVLREEGGFSHTEIGFFLGVAPTTVRSYLLDFYEGAA